MPSRIAARLLLVTAVAVAAVAACSRGPGPRFPHSAHLAGLHCGEPGQPECLSCSTCHTPSAIDREHKLPGAERCETCHQEDKQIVGRVLAVKPDRPSGEIHFDHAKHLAMDGIGGQCVPCHGGVVTGKGPHLPPMSQCFGCHEHEEEWRQGKCTPCHDPTALQKTLPQTFMRHEGTFARRHGQAAMQEPRLCQSCHGQADCDDCHDVSQGLSVERRRPEQIERTFVHRGDFLARHAMEAEAEPARCVTCHAPATCDACHLERGVSAGLRGGGRNPHPPGWVGQSGNGPSAHGREARRNIVLCAGCHDQGPRTNCVACHAVGGPGGNPHPEGWRSGRKEGAQMCRYCHE